MSVCGSPHGEQLLELLHPGEPCGVSGDVGIPRGWWLCTHWAEITVLSECDTGRCMCKGVWGARVPTVPLVRHHRKTSSMLEVDDEGGRTFLRVLIHLTMHDYAPLVSGALQLLFKHFSQRQEAMHTFKQVPPPSEPLGLGGLRVVVGCPSPALAGAGRSGLTITEELTAQGSSRCFFRVLGLAEVLKEKGPWLATFMTSWPDVRAVTFL